MNRANYQPRFDELPDDKLPKPQILVLVDCGKIIPNDAQMTTSEPLQDKAAYFVIDNVNDIVHHPKMALTEYEQQIISDLTSGNFEFSEHFINDRKDRSVSKQDVQRAAGDWVDCWTEQDSRGDVVHIVGPDLDGDEIEVRAGYDGGTVVITVVDVTKANR